MNLTKNGDPDKHKPNDTEDFLNNKKSGTVQKQYLIQFFFNKKKDILIIQNAVRVVKIFNAEKQLVQIQTAAKNREPTIFDTKKFKKGVYKVIVADKQFIFIK
ncbi:MAG: hypothetical protein PW786_09150 [Arachidicoccus sp.]|nr:hypothetical protein [Arachidicoccus sp.]